MACEVARAAGGEGHTGTTISNIWAWAAGASWQKQQQQTAHNCSLTDQHLLDFPVKQACEADNLDCRSYEDGVSVQGQAFAGFDCGAYGL